MPLGRADDDRDDRFGFGETDSYLSAAVGKLVPQWLARRAIAVSVTTDRSVYDPGDTVAVTIEFSNRLPVPVTVRTPRRRLWGWTVDGDLAASDEDVYTRREGGEFVFAPGETKRVRREWDGRFQRDGDPPRWVPAPAGEHEIAAFVAVEGYRRPEDATTVRIR